MPSFNREYLGEFPPPIELMWVSLPSATFVLEVQDNQVVDGAPYGMAIIRRIKCKHADKVWRYFAAMNGSRLEWL